MAASQNQWTEATQKAVAASIELAKENANSQLTPAHLASALLTPAEGGAGGGTTLFHSILNKGTLFPLPPRQKEPQLTCYRAFSWRKHRNSG
jgi:hypothetical protein